MADKTQTSLTSHSLFPSGGDGFDLDQLSGPFSFAPALVPTSSSPVVQPSSGNANVEIDLNPDVLEGEVEKFVGQPVTPPTTPRKGEVASPPRQSSTPPREPSTPPRQPSTPPTVSYAPPTASYGPPTANPPHSIYSPMEMQPQINVSYQQAPMQPPMPTQTTSSKPIHAVPPFTQSQQSIFPPVMSSPYPPSAPPPTPEQRVKASLLRPHWFYLKHGKVWTPFSWKDSNLLQQSFLSPPRGNDRIIATDGGRYDVNIDKRTRTSMYWTEPVTVVRPCTWFCKAHDGENKLIPYEESIAATLEQAYLDAYDDQRWPKTVNLEKGETVIMHNSNVMVHFSATSNDNDEWTGEDIRSRPKVVRRGIDDFESEIDDGEPSQIDHLVFVVHGIGPYADLKFRSLIECVNDFRRVSLEMMDGRREKLTGNQDNLVGRIEFLPVLWHGAVHDDMPTGVDRRLHSITINSVTKLREFTNNTLLDILFFTSPVYCQTIVDKVGSEMNRLLNVFQDRNPSFNGSISVCGHSLGSAICFDILQHQGDQQQNLLTTKDGGRTNIQRTPTETNNQAKQEIVQNTDSNKWPSLEQILQRLGLENFILTFQLEQIDGEALMMCSEDDLKELSIPMGPRKKILSYQKDYAKEKEAAKQSIGNMIAPSTSTQNTVTATFTEAETTDPLLNTSRSSFGSISQNSSSIEVVEILQYHHGGQQGTAGTGQPYVRYPKLNFEPRNLFALGSPIGLFLTVRGVENIGNDYSFPTCPGFYNIFHPAYRIEPLVVEGFIGEPVLMQHHKGRKRMHLELRENLTRIGANLKQKFVESVKETWASINDFARAHTGVQSSDEHDSPGARKDTSDTESQSDVEERREMESIAMGRLNQGQRFDFVLQEKPIEILNEYLFALSSHVCYWQSEDTALFMLKEIYKN